MSAIPIFMVLFVLGVVTSSPQKDISGFTMIGKIRGSYYFLSNIDDKRGISDARTGCHDAFLKAQLVALETDAEHNEVRQRLSSWGVTDRDRVWTTGQHDGDKWVWYDYENNVGHPIENVCGKPWVNGVCPEDGCLAIGGRDLTYRWQTDDCEGRRRYLCELHEEEEEDFLN